MHTVATEFPCQYSRRVQPLYVQIKEMAMRKNWISCMLALPSMAGVTWSQTGGSATKAVEALELQ
jgi:hypothetical protein